MASSRRSFEGQLHKYTNVMKGWQYRWFMLYPDTGTLAYFMPDDAKRQRPRGAVKLSGAVISPSDEDSQTFSVNFATGDTFKLRAVDAKERQLWVNKLRTITQQHTQPLSQQKLPRRFDQVDGSPHSNLFKANSELMMFPSSTCATEAITEVKSIIVQTQVHFERLSFAIESLQNLNENYLSSCDKDLLLMKATSRATVLCLEQCYVILSRGSCPVGEKRKSIKSLSVNSSAGHRSSTSSTAGSMPLPVTPTIPPLVPDNEEFTDEEMTSIEVNCLSPEDNKNVILYSLSQLKLGMDLTKVTLPTFILEPYSLLEMYSDFFNHPESFIKIVDFPTPQERMISVLKWYLTSFSIGRPKSIARKPYNPILGETFQCSWKTKKPKNPTETVNKDSSFETSKVNFVAEQVSHHPPTSAFYVECVDKQLYVNGHLSTRSKFMGMSIGVNMVGEVVLCDMKHNEEYIITVPSVHARSILSVPWVEFGGKVTITSNSGYLAAAIFHPKPFYGGKLHRITAEVKISSGDVLCKVNGEWNGLLEFAFNDGTANTVNTSDVVKTKKRVQNMIHQSKLDSRKVWENVSKALRGGDIKKAAQFKQELEENQRVDEKLRKTGQGTFQTQFFQKDDDGKWIYRRLVKGDAAGK